MSEEFNHLQFHDHNPEPLTVIEVSEPIRDALDRLLPKDIDENVSFAVVIYASDTREVHVRIDSSDVWAVNMWDLLKTIKFKQLKKDCYLVRECKVDRYSAEIVEYREWAEFWKGNDQFDETETFRRLEPREFTASDARLLSQLNHELSNNFTVAKENEFIGILQEFVGE